MERFVKRQKFKTRVNERKLWMERVLYQSIVDDKVTGVGRGQYRE